MSASGALIGLLKVLSREEPEKLARWKETIQDLLDEGVVNASVGTIALAFDELDDSENIEHPRLGRTKKERAIINVSKKRLTG